MPDLLTSANEITEADILALHRTIAHAPALRRLELSDVTAYWSTLDVAALNVITNATFEQSDVADRAREVIAPFMQRRQAFRWITTPSTTTPALEAFLAQSGLRPSEFPAMQTTLLEPIDPRTPDEVFIDVAWPEQVPDVNSIIFDSLELPLSASTDHLEILESMDPASNQFLVARLLSNGSPIGVGTMHRRESSVLLANLGASPTARNLGVSRAITATMLNRAMASGATTASVVASPQDYQSYVDLGFRTKFNMVIWSWSPHLTT